MRLDTIFIRFYKSFNVDRERQYLATDNQSTKPNKSNKKITEYPWEMIKADDNNLWFPFIKVPIEPQITAVVGANESGKSHLLTAIEKAITGRDYKNHKISASDFCRYSDRFLITADKLRIPDFVTEWSEVSKEEADQIKEFSDIPKAQEFDRFLLLRKNINELIIYLPHASNPHPVKPDAIEQFQKVLPRTRRLDTTTALPDSVPIQKLVQIINGKPEGTRYELLSFEKRENIRLLLDQLMQNSSFFQKSPTSNAPSSNNEEKKGDELINNLLKELESHYVLQIGDLRVLGVNLPEKLKDAQIEDLIPLRIGVLAAHRYVKVIWGMAEQDIKDIKEEDIQKKLNEGMTMFKAVYSCVEAASKDKRQLSKLPFARYVIEVVEAFHKRSCSDQKDLDPKDLNALNEFNHNFKILFRELDERIGEAELERTSKKASEKILSLQESFFNNHPNGANKEDAVGFLHKLNVLLTGDTSFDAEAIMKAVESIRKDYQLDTNLTERIDKYEEFKREIKGLNYQGKKKARELAEEG